MDTEDTGLTQQLRTANPSILREVPGTGTDQQGADAWPWLDEDEVSNSGYSGQQDHQGSEPEEGSPTVSSPVDIPEGLQSDNDDPGDPDDTWYPDTLEIGTGTTQDSDQTTCPGAAQEGTTILSKEPPLPRRDHSGSERTTRGKNKPGGTKDDDVGIIQFAPVSDEFSCIKRPGRPPGVKLKNTARVYFAEPVFDSKPRGENDIINEFSSQPGVQGASSKQGETCESTSDTILLSKRLHDAEFPMLKKILSEVDHNFFSWRGSKLKGKWADIVKKNMK